MIANQIRDNGDADELFDKIRMVVNKFLNIDVEYLGGIPYDNNMQRAVMRQEPVSMSAPESQAARSLERIARRLENKVEEKQEFGIVQLFTKVFSAKFYRR